MSNIAQMAEPENIVKGAFRPNSLVRMLQRVQAWNQRRVAIRELNAMSDSLLRDLGIERYQISDVVNRTGDFSGLERIAPVSTINSVVSLERKEAA
jgi:uncharacterized protein YjiS (DUF1127 family)